MFYVLKLSLFSCSSFKLPKNYVTYSKALEIDNN